VRLAGPIVVLAVAGCTGTGSAPATAPATTTTTTATTTSAPTTTTTVPETTTTVDRIAEIQAIYQDLEVRRLDALQRNDEAAFRALFANEAYLAESLQLLGQIEVPGDPALAEVTVEEVIVDRADCIVAVVTLDLLEPLGAGSVGTRTLCWSPWVAPGDIPTCTLEEGWVCDEPHPLSQ
jgi:hypothetical protein